jgi:flagellar basal body-associated protein FliL
MADAENESQQDQKSTKPGLLGLVIWALVGVISAATGFAAPMLFLSMSKTNAEPVPTQPVFVQFGETVVNLDEGRLNRYLRVSITLQIDEKDEEECIKQLEKHRTILKSWLLSYLSDKTMDDIRGRTGQNRLRREIQNQFNTLLFSDGYERVKDVLFEEFNIQ